MLTNIQVVDDIIHNNFDVELDKEIGRGKYGIVYSGVDQQSRRNCAIKVISLPTPELEEKLRNMYGDDPETISNAVREMANKFQTEIKSMQMLGSLNAPGSGNIVHMNNHILIQDGMYFHLIISMELVLPLKRYLVQNDFTVGRVIEIGYETARGLQLCHSEGVIHRDIKEDNLFLDAKGNVKIGDFGVANMSYNVVSKKTEGVGTPHYMAPEINNNQEYNHSVDIYSLGIVMYMLLNDNMPAFCSGGVDERTAYNKRMAGEALPPPRHAPKLLSDIILKCCQFNPENRYRNMAELMNDLEYAKNALDRDELRMIVPYPKRMLADTDWWDRKLNTDATKSMYQFDEQEIKAPPKQSLRDTIGAFMDILQKFGNRSSEGRVIEGIYQEKGAAERDMNEAQRRVKVMRRVLIAILCVVVVLAAAAVLLYPKTAVFYPNTADGQKIYVKYMFFPERKFSERAASYLTVDGNDVYFSEPKLNKSEDHRLYKINIWTGAETMLYDGECEYDVIIGDYIYFTDWKQKKHLFRIKKDGTDLEEILEYPCGDLKNVGGSLKFMYAADGNPDWFEEKNEAVKNKNVKETTLDVTTIG